jgi:hypothetical protein
MVLSDPLAVERGKLTAEDSQVVQFSDRVSPLMVCTVDCASQIPQIARFSADYSEKMGTKKSGAELKGDRFRR